MRTVLASYETNTCHPFIDKPGILSGAEMTIVINPAWKDIIVYRATPAFKPCQQAGSGVRQQFKLNRPACLLLHHDRALSDLKSDTHSMFGAGA